MSLLEGAGAEWAALGAAIRALRASLPLRTLADFGFSEEEDNPLEEANPRCARSGSASRRGPSRRWATARSTSSTCRGSEKRIGSEFGFERGDETLLLAAARLGDYRALLEKLLIIQALGGMATEVVAVTPEGILVAKQTLGEPLPQGDDMSARPAAVPDRDPVAIPAGQPRPSPAALPGQKLPTSWLTCTRATSCGAPTGRYA